MNLSKQLAMNLLFSLRARINRVLNPVAAESVAFPQLQPVSRKFGFERGTPIDRYWIEKFLSAHQADIKGKCLEVGDNRYTRQFGKEKVSSSEILDVDRKNRRATIHDDLTRLKTVPDETFDCLVITHVLGMIADCEAAVKSCYRVLKPGGVILLTSACFSPVYQSAYWRFTPQGISYLFSKAFPKNKIFVTSFGNVWAGQCFWSGLAQEDIEQKILDYQDPDFPCLVAVKAVKSKQ